VVSAPERSYQSTWTNLCTSLPYTYSETYANTHSHAKAYGYTDTQAYSHANT
jgi:hypothetical protein